MATYASGLMGCAIGPLSWGNWAALRERTSSMRLTASDCRNRIACQSHFVHYVPDAPMCNTFSWTVIKTQRMFTCGAFDGYLVVPGGRSTTQVRTEAWFLGTNNSVGLTESDTIKFRGKDIDRKPTIMYHHLCICTHHICISYIHYTNHICIW